jgi:two-component system response regulator GlrR
MNQMTEAKQKILTVDDDPDILKLLGMRLEAAGYHVVPARNAEEALAQIALSRPALVITSVAFSVFLPSRLTANH